MHTYNANVKRVLVLGVLLSIIMLVTSFAAAQTIEVTMTAYSSEAGQTDADPLVTATGEEVGPGTLAASRDLLNTDLPYGTVVRVVEVNDEANACGGWEVDMLLEVQDTLHPRMLNRVDLWLPSRDQAVQWGRCEVVLEILS